LSEAGHELRYGILSGQIRTEKDRLHPSIGKHEK